MVLFKKIAPITVLILLICVGTGYGANYEFSYYTVDEAIAVKKENPRVIYVDTRREEDFQRVRIPTSINVPIHFVKTKAYLKDMDIILINQGYSFSKLQREGELLKRQGFRVAILVGGIAAWHQQGQRLNGDRFAVQSLHLITAAELLVEPANTFLKLRVNVSPRSKKNGALGDSLHQPVDNVEDLPGLITTIDTEGLDERSNVLIYNEKGDYSLLAALPQQCKPTIFFLKGGTDEFQLKVGQQQALLQPREKRIKKVGGCSTCPSASAPKIEENQ